MNKKFPRSKRKLGRRQSIQTDTIIFSMKTNVLVVFAFVFLVSSAFCGDRDTLSFHDERVKKDAEPATLWWTEV